MKFSFLPNPSKYLFLGMFKEELPVITHAISFEFKSISFDLQYTKFHHTVLNYLHHDYQHKSIFST
jgi:hypothetical protein